MLKQRFGILIRRNEEVVVSQAKSTENFDQMMPGQLMSTSLSLCVVIFVFV